MNYSHEYHKTTKSVMSKKLYALPAALILVVILFIAGCTEKCTDGTCCEEVEALVTLSPHLHTDTVDYPYWIYSGTLHPSVFYYYYLGGTPARVVFFAGITKDDICNSPHLNINFNVTTTPYTGTRPIKIYGEIYWSAFSDDIILFDGVVQPDHNYSGTLSDVGLKQAFPDGAATADIYINVEFESFGNFDLDKEFLQDHIFNMNGKYIYKQF